MTDGFLEMIKTRFEQRKNDVNLTQPEKNFYYAGLMGELEIKYKINLSGTNCNQDSAVMNLYNELSTARKFDDYPGEVLDEALTEACCILSEKVYVNELGRNRTVDEWKKFLLDKGEM